MLYPIISTLKSLKGNAKVTYLQEQKDNALLRRFFELALNPYIKFGIRKIPQYTPAQVAKMTLPEAFTELEKLSNRELTGNAAIAHLQSVLESLSAEDAKALELVVLKDPDCGIQEKTFNKIHPKSIPKYPVLLCSPLSEKLIDKLNWDEGVYVQLKSDGARANILIDEEGKVEVVSREGRTIHVNGRFDPLGRLYKSVMIDGELLYGNPRTGQPHDRSSSNGIVNKGIAGTISEEESDQMFMTVWDVIPLDNVRTATDYKVPYETRFNNLAVMCDLASDLCLIHLIESDLVNSYEEAELLYAQRIAKKQEGVIIKSRTHFWSDTRSTECIKLKEILECDLLVTGWKYGKAGGKHEHGLGSLVCQTRCGLLEVSVSGISDENRKLWFDNPELVVDKIAVCQYNSVTKNKKTGVHSLFLPSVLQVRLDKTEANSLEELLT